jgi:hypothetical protein
VRQELETVLSVVRALPSAELPAFIGQIAEVQAVALARLTAPVPVALPADRDGQDLLDVETAANYINMSAKWLYRNYTIVPHLRIGNGTRPRLRFRRRDLDGWIEEHRAGKAKRSKH